jgi:hypothetical protein
MYMLGPKQIKEDILEYKQHIEGVLEKFKVMKHDVKQANPSLIRKNLDKLWGDIIHKETETTVVIDKLNECVKELNECKSIMGEINKILQVFKPVYNSATIGTLQGLTREAIKQHEIEPDDDDGAVEFVLEQNYHELEDIRAKSKSRRSHSRGGRKKTTRKRK